MHCVNSMWDVYVQFVGSLKTVKALPHAAIKWTISLQFRASRSITDHHRSLQVSPSKLQQCGQSAAHDGISPYSPAIYITVMANGNIYLRIMSFILHESLLNADCYAENHLKIRQ